MFRKKAESSSLSTVLSDAINSMRSFHQIRSTIGPNDEKEYKEALHRAHKLQEERRSIDAWDAATDNYDLGPEVSAAYKKAYQRDEPNKQEMETNQNKIARLELKFKNMSQATQKYKLAITKLIRDSKYHLKTADITDELRQEIKACLGVLNQPREMIAHQNIETNVIKLVDIFKKIIKGDNSMDRENPGPNAPY